MNSVMASIRPKHTADIKSGKKTLEIRKSIPKIQTPFKCYIYETMGPAEVPWLDEDGHHIFKGCGMVIGDFVCDMIFEIKVDFNVHDELPGNPVETWLTWEDAPEGYETTEALEKAACLTIKEIDRYIGKADRCYCWHISNLNIYSKPKELSCFSSGSSVLVWKKDSDETRWSGMKRPPQSWCYVDEEE